MKGGEGRAEEVPTLPRARPRLRGLGLGLGLGVGRGFARPPPPPGPSRACGPATRARRARASLDRRHSRPRQPPRAPRPGPAPPPARPQRPRTGATRRRTRGARSRRGLPPGGLAHRRPRGLQALELAVGILAKAPGQPRELGHARLDARRRPSEEPAPQRRRENGDRVGQVGGRGGRDPAQQENAETPPRTTMAPGSSLAAARPGWGSRGARGTGAPGPRAAPRRADGRGARRQGRPSRRSEPGAGASPPRRSRPARRPGRRRAPPGLGLARETAPGSAPRWARRSGRARPGTRLPGTGARGAGLRSRSRRERNTNGRSFSIPATPAPGLRWYAGLRSPPRPRSS